MGPAWRRRRKAAATPAPSADPHYPSSAPGRARLRSGSPSAPAPAPASSSVAAPVAAPLGPQPAAAAATGASRDLRRRETSSAAQAFLRVGAVGWGAGGGLGSTSPQAAPKQAGVLPAWSAERRGEIATSTGTTTITDRGHRTETNPRGNVSKAGVRGRVRDTVEPGPPLQVRHTAPPNAVGRARDDPSKLLVQADDKAQQGAPSRSAPGREPLGAPQSFRRHSFRPLAPLTPSPS
jgi:hypothetical protein